MILIDMEMPESCNVCPISDDEVSLCCAFFPEEHWLEYNCDDERPDWCPLKEVPDEYKEVLQAWMEWMETRPSTP